MKSSKHCKVQFSVLEQYSDETLRQIIELNGKQYVINYSPRPCKTESELFAVYVDGIRFSTFAKFLKIASEK